VHPHYTIAITGGGPRALGVLERLIAIYRDQKPSWEIDVHLIDPAEPGRGAHPVLQAEHLLTNTVAGQITLFSDPSVTGAGVVVPGPSFLHWARASGYRRVANRFIKTDRDGEEIHENDYLPRSLLGEYLTDIYDLLCAKLPDGLRVHHPRRRVDDISKRADGGFCLRMDSGTTLNADFVVLATGHSENHPDTEQLRFYNDTALAQHTNHKLQYFSHPYPLEKLASIAADAHVGIQGMGLTAYDVISALTEGRGGHFIQSADGQLSYQASGREPHMVLFSRQGLPHCARGANQKGVGGQVKARFFTREWIAALRQKKLAHTGSPQLNFAKDLWPMMKQEMAYVHASVRLRLTEHGTSDELPQAEDLMAIDRLMAPLGEGYFDKSEDYLNAVLNYVAQDLEQAEGGNVMNPVKAATDVLRDIRDNLRYAVEFSGLTPASHQEFLQHFCPLMNRIAVGPPLSRNRELQALYRAGLLSFGPGPAPQLDFDTEQARFTLSSTRLQQPSTVCFDVLVRAKLDSFYPERDRSPLVANLLKQQIIRPYRNGDFHPGGIDVNRAQNVIAANGQVQPNFWALGNPTEGANFYTFILPRPLVNSRSIQDAGRCVLQLFSCIEQQQQPEQQHSVTA